MRTDRRKIVGEYVRQRIADETKPRGARAELSRRVKVSTAHLSNVVNGKANVGDDFAHTMAAHWGLTYQELQDAAVEWAKGHPLPPSEPRQIDSADPYPNRARAIEAARLLGYDEQDIDTVRNVAGFKSDHDPPPDVWLARIQQARAEREYPALRPVGTRLTAADREPPPRGRKK